MERQFLEAEYELEQEPFQLKILKDYSAFGGALPGATWSVCLRS